MMNEVNWIQEAWNARWIIGLVTVMIVIAIIVWKSWGKRVYAIEKKFVVHWKGYEVIGQPDRVEQLWGGNLCIIDFKNRQKKQWYQSDKIQLSGYAWMLRKKGKKVHNVGYIETREGRIAVPLMTGAAYEKWMGRYIQVHNGELDPKECSSKAYCRQCEYFKKECTPKGVH